MPVIDTSVLVALLNERDEHYHAAHELLDTPGAHVIPSVILQEFLTVAASQVAKAAGRAQANDAVRAIYQSFVAQPAVRVRPDYDVDGAGRLFVSNRELSYADAVAVTVARTTRDKLYTFDAAQAAAVESK